MFQRQISLIEKTVCFQERKNNMFVHHGLGSFFFLSFSKGRQWKSWCILLHPHWTSEWLCLSHSQTISPFTQAVISLTSTLWRIMWCEVEGMHILKSSPSPTCSGFSWTKAGREKGHKIHSCLFLVYSLNQFMKPPTSGELKTTGISFLLQRTQNTFLPFCLSLVCHLLLSPLLGTSPSQSTLNSFVFPCSPPSLMSSFTDVSSDLFHLYLFLSSRLKQTGLDSWSSHRTRKLPGCCNRKHWYMRQGTTESWHEMHAWALHPWETWPNGLKQGTGKGLHLRRNLEYCCTRMYKNVDWGWASIFSSWSHFTVLTCSLMSASLSTWPLGSEGQKFLLWNWACSHSVQVTLS